MNDLKNSSGEVVIGFNFVPVCIGEAATHITQALDGGG